MIMDAHNLFYYPYASFGDKQKLLLKAAALYFDKLYILDPNSANWGGVGPSQLNHELELLEKEKILVRISPEEVLHKYENYITDSIYTDLDDPDYLKCCEKSGLTGRWTLALAKVPKNVRDDPKFKSLDRSMQYLMGDTAKKIIPGLGGGYTTVYDEVRMNGLDMIDYRYADYPLPLGESIMMNHALFGALLFTDSTPITDDPFHNQILSLKIRKAQKIPEINRILQDRAKQRGLKSDLLAMTALTDLDLSILPQNIPMETILEYRHENESELRKTRTYLNNFVRKIKLEPWTEKFYDHLEYDAIPKLQEDLSHVKEMQKDWLFKSTGIALAGTAIVLSIMATPLLAVEVAIVAGLVGHAAAGLDLVNEWRKGSQNAAGNGIQYLLKIPGR